MNNKKLLIMLFGIILLSSGAFAVNELSNLNGIDLPATIIGGSTIQANFSFNYINNENNEDNVPLIVKLNMKSSDNVNYPVWRGDFVISGYLEKSYFFKLFTKTIYFNCSEESLIEINHTINSVLIENNNTGTFYCYNDRGDLELDERDNVFLDITPNTAIWPGTYTLSAQLFYLNDTTDPVVLILNNSYFNQYFRDGSYVDFEAKIYDGSGIQNYNAKIIEDTQNFSFSKELTTNETYHFYQTLPLEITEDEHIVRVIAIDNYGNQAEKTATIKIDLTSPAVNLDEPKKGFSYDSFIPIKINATDIKSGLNRNEVYYRIREVKEGFGLCPTYGEGFGEVTCYNSGWVNAPYDSELELNYNEFDSNNIPQGEYWLEVRAQDILGNSGVLE